MQATPLSTSAERVDKDRVKLRVEVPEDALQPALNMVYRDLAGQIKVPGFRKGKVPRQIIDSRVGAGFVRAEAIKEALPGFYERALESEELEAIAPPEIELVQSEAGAPIVFEAIVDIRPEVTVPDLGSINVDAPSDEVTDEQLNEQLERLQDRFAELENIGREARRGDYALIDIKAYHHEELAEGASAPDLLYEIGSGSGPPKLDDELQGTRPGAILKFNDTVPDGAELAGRELSFTVLVKEIKTKKLPQLDDDFAKTVGEFDTLDELKTDLRARMADFAKAGADDELRSRGLEALVAASDLDPPPRLVESEFQHRLNHLEEDLQPAGLTVGQYADRIESTELEIRDDLRRGAGRSVKAELLLEEIARREKLEVTQEDVGHQIALLAARSDADPQELAKQIVASGRLSSLAADIMRRKALDYLVNNVNVVGRRTDTEESAEKQSPNSRSTADDQSD